MKHQHLAVGQKATYVDPEGKAHEAVIETVYNEDEVRVTYKHGSAIARFSDGSKPNTFHFEQASPEVGTKK